jgi:glutaconate CoA-transferase subunit A
MKVAAKNKVTSMKDAIQKYVRDGDTVYLGGFIQGEPYAAIHEIIRQRKKELTISKAAAIIHIDMLVGAGCVNRLITTYFWSPIPKPCHAFRRALEQQIPHPLELEEYPLLALTLAYFAGSTGLPFVATKAMLGTSFTQYRSFLGEKKFKVIDSPFDGQKVCLIPGLNHDVGIIQAQRADELGNTQAWGLLASTKHGINSCKNIIVCVEEIVSAEVIKQDPNRTIVPGLRVSAVVQEPWGSYPSYIQGYYDRDFRFFPAYERATRTVEGFEQYLEKWVYGVEGRAEYMKKIGPERLEKLKVSPKESLPVNYGDYTTFPEIDPF